MTDIVRVLPHGAVVVGILQAPAATTMTAVHVVTSALVAMTTTAVALLHLVITTSVTVDTVDVLHHVAHPAVVLITHLVDTMTHMVRRHRGQHRTRIRTRMGMELMADRMQALLLLGAAAPQVVLPLMKAEAMTGVTGDYPLHSIPHSFQNSRYFSQYGLPSTPAYLLRSRTSPR